MTRKINKAVLPAAGLGSRVLPATKALAKEMLPLVDRPIIQHVVEEALAAGVTEFIFITAPAKKIIQEHFQTNAALEQELARRGKQELLRSVESIFPPDAACRYVVQDEPLGLGHAVLCARDLVGDEPFAVMLPDDLVYQKGRPCLRQLADVYRQYGASVIAVENVAPEKVSRYGVIDADDAGAAPVKKVRSLVEKPAPEQAPSTLAVVGRYLFTPRIMDLLEATPRGAGGEIQLTDAIAALAREEDVYACEIEGRRNDCGDVLGYMKANAEYALRHETIGAEFRAHLQRLLDGGRAE